MSTVGVGPQSVQLTVEHKSKTGRRKSNQDAALLVEVVPGRVYLVGVADGMGGYAGGEQASAAAVKHIQLFGEVLRSHLPDDDKMALRFIRDRIEGLYTDVQREIQEIAVADPNLAQMGTTLVLAAVCGRYFFVANIGDSRAYLLYRDARGQDVFRQITEDHTVANDLRRLRGPGESAPPESPEAQKMGKALTRALRPNTPSRPELFPPDSADSPGYVGNDGDTLLISSDGMYGSVSEDDMEVILVESSSLLLALEKLEDRAYANESADNITTVAVDFGPRDPRRKSARRSVVGVTDTMLNGDFSLPRPPQPSPNGPSPLVPPPPADPPSRSVPLAAILIGSALLLGAGAFGISAAFRQTPSSPTPAASMTAPLPTPVPDATGLPTPEPTEGRPASVRTRLNETERRLDPDRERTPTVRTGSTESTETAAPAPRRTKPPAERPTGRPSVRQTPKPGPKPSGKPSAGSRAGDGAAGGAETGHGRKVNEGLLEGIRGTPATPKPQGNVRDL